MPDAVMFIVTHPEADVLAGLRQLYAPGKDGQILFSFPRLFFTAVKP